MLLFHTVNRHQWFEQDHALMPAKDFAGVEKSFRTKHRDDIALDGFDANIDGFAINDHLASFAFMAVRRDMVELFEVFFEVACREFAGTNCEVIPVVLTGIQRHDQIFIPLLSRSSMLTVKLETIAAL